MVRSKPGRHQAKPAISRGTSAAPIWYSCRAHSAPAKESTMPRHAQFVPHGVIPAVLLPFNDDLSIDEKGFRGHLRDVAPTKGVSAVTVTAHSAEGASVRFDDQRRVLR